MIAARFALMKVSPRGAIIGDLLGVLADDPFRNVHEEIDPARHFHRRRGHDNREHDEKYFAGDVRRRDIKTNDKHEQPHGPPQAEPNTAHPSAHRQRAHDDEKFKN